MTVAIDIPSIRPAARRAVAGLGGGLAIGVLVAFARARFGWFEWSDPNRWAIAWIFRPGAFGWIAAAAAAGVVVAVATRGRLRCFAAVAACGPIALAAATPWATAHATWPFLARVVVPAILLSVLFPWTWLLRWPSAERAGEVDRREGDARREFLAPATVCVVTFLLAGSVGMRVAGQRGYFSGDEAHYLLQARSIVEDGDTDLANQLGLHPVGLDEDVRRLHHLSAYSAPGHLYSRHPVGLSFLIAPGVAMAGDAGATWIIVLLATLIAWNIYAAARDAGCAPATAFDLWSAFAVATPFLVYGSRVYPEIAGALWALYAARVIAHGGRAIARGDRAGAHGDGAGWLRWIVAAAAVGTLPLLHAPRYWPAAAILAAWGAWRPLRERRWGSFAAWAVVIALAWAILLAWNGVRFSSAGDVSAVRGSFAGGYNPRHTGPVYPFGPFAVLLGLRKGLVYVAPGLVAVGLAAVWGAWRRRRDPAAVIPVVAFAAGAVPIAFTWAWMGGLAAHPGRLFLVGLPVLVLPAARWLRDRPRRPLANPAWRLAIAISILNVGWLLRNPGFFDRPLAMLAGADPAAAGFIGSLPFFYWDRNPFLEQLPMVVTVVAATAWWVARGVAGFRRRPGGPSDRGWDPVLAAGIVFILAAPVVGSPPPDRPGHETAFTGADRVENPEPGTRRLCLSPATGSVRPPRVVIRAGALHGAVGVVEAADPLDTDGPRVRFAEVAPGEPEAWVVFGPSIRVPPGRYVARVDADLSGDDPSLRWDVRPIGDPSVVSVGVTGPDGPWSAPFVVENASRDIDIRVCLWRGRVAVRAITVERVLDADP